MTEKTLEQRIIGSIAASLECDPAKVVRDAKIMGDLGADSLDVVELVMTIEEEFDVEVPDDAIPLDPTVGDVIDFVTKART